MHLSTEPTNNWCDKTLRRRKLLPISLALTLTCFALFSGLGYINSEPTLNTIILYVAADNTQPIIGDQINFTVVFKNFLNETESLSEVVVETTTSAEINITNVFDASFNETTYNATQYYVDDENSTNPIFWIEENYFNITWAKFHQNMTYNFWFTVNCTDTGLFFVDNPYIHYKLDNETNTVRGSGYNFEVKDIPVTTSIPSPARGDWTWQWWFVGSVLVVLPIIVIVITRLTLWKR